MNRQRFHAMKRTCLFLLAALIVFLPRDAQAAPSPERLFCIHPFMRPSDLLERFTPMAKWLSEASGVTFRLKVYSSYGTHINDVGENQCDIAYMGPIPYLRVITRYGKKPVLAQLEVNGKSTFNGSIVVRTESPLTSIEQVRGKRFAFGDVHSSMGNVLPRIHLRKVGITLEDLGAHGHLNGHDNVALSVLSGRFEVGAVKESVFRKYATRGLRELDRIPEIGTHLFVTRSDLSPTLIKTLSQTLVEMKRSFVGRSILTAIKPSITGLNAVDPNYDARLLPLVSIIDQLEE
ncbi:MAG: PhnD/SsuA/transferrin family substrate-binding protein [Magnetococcales bacterium]|nr:PhnD/SsuA/transferrin family substrate-binding protein [Magnetococcales bacterium]